MSRSETENAQGKMNRQQGNRQGTGRGSGAMQTRGQGGQGRGLAQRGTYTPALFSLSPRDILSATPFELMRRFSEQLGEVFEEFGMTDTGTSTGQGSGTSQMPTWIPSIEVFQRDNNLVVRAELPGVDNEDIRVIMTDDGLIIEGERRDRREENDEGFYRSELFYGRFYRLIPLPDDVDTDQIQARFDNGVLEITVPIPERQERRREIPVGTQGSGQSQGSDQSQGSGQSQAASAQTQS